MRLLPLLALTGAAVAQQGQPGMMDKLNAWVANFKLQISNLVPSSIDAGASAIAGQVVQPLTLQNWKAHVGPKPHEPEEWLVFITGGNKTCFGRCDHVDATWNVCTRPSMVSQILTSLSEICRSLDRAPEKPRRTHSPSRENQLRR